jgi:hypothetical protein
MEWIPKMEKIISYNKDHTSSLSCSKICLKSKVIIKTSKIFISVPCRDHISEA